MQKSLSYSPYNLTNRELSVIFSCWHNHTNTKIANDLCISPHTVKVHMAHILKKLNVKNRVEALIKAEITGIIQFCICSKLQQFDNYTKEEMIRLFIKDIEL